MMDTYRPLLLQHLKQNENRQTDLQLLQELEQPLPLVTVARHRLLLFGRLVASKNFQLQCVVSAAMAYHGSWLQAVKKSLDLLAHSNKLTELRGCSLTELVQFTQSIKPHVFKKVISAAAKDPAVLTLAIQQELVKTSASQHAATDGHALPLDPTAPLPQDSETPFQCHICGSIESTQGRLNQHMAKFHKVRDPINLKIQHTHCAHCLQEFHTLTRLKAHIRDTR